MANPDVTGDFASFNTLQLGGVPVTPGGSPQSFCSVHTASQNISDSTPAVINSFSTVSNTNPSALSPNSNTGVIINQAGVYHCTAYVSFQGGSPAAGVREVDLTINGTSTAVSIIPQVADGSQGTVTRTPASVTWSQQFNAGDVIGVAVYQSSGNINIINASLQVWK